MNGGDSRAHLGFGSHAEGVSWVGRSTPPRPCSDSVNHPQIKVFAGLVRDANRAYWDEQWATDSWGGVLSPPGMLMVWSWPLAWVPPQTETFAPMLASLVPLPGDRVVNASSQTSFDLPIQVGDLLSVEEIVTAVSPERSTALGPGHFVTTEATYRREDGSRVATHGNTMLRYRAGALSGAPAPLPPAPPKSRAVALADPNLPSIGASVRAITLDVTLETCVHDVAATRDFLPAHYDADYARASGAPQPFLNTMFVHGFIDRVCTDWAGPLSRVVRRDAQFHSPVFAGDEVHAVGQIVEVSQVQDNCRTVGLQVLVRSGDRLAASARCDVRIGAAAKERTPHADERKS